ncbi:MAG TPA: (2Fe-2S)-binding protein [Rhodospirillales bacterium]|nr:(2Fe-2S)-binding protein [Rhodospirillales bacterium]HIA81397.1 (2Fe-2S)-binding protein [Rhodospirillales bacterium]HIB22526.1 (2Fe-2S)-binding protein [Rhodospirillales bacterium]HIN76902.1 (2Fe-2S)-binding protein [Rhodospirillales bacterium]HIO37834.1 (2Fe-2S)-binding protein [Rhodospirillales bacterium]
MSDRKISLTLNGREISETVEPRLHLADFLRHTLGATGTHLGCEHGVCGACTVNVDGEAIRSCLMFAVQADGKNIITIEGISNTDGTLHPIQEAFRHHHGLQCGFCTSGMIITLDAFLKKHPNPTEVEIRSAISGNICRCTGYQSIVAAALEAAGNLKKQEV